MKPQKTKINVRDTEKITARLTIIEKGCRERLFDMTRIERAIKKAEIQLSRFGIATKYHIGCQIELDSEKLPNAYRGVAYGTEIRLKRFPTGWFVTHIHRVPCSRTAYGRSVSENLFLSDTAKRAIPSIIAL